MWQQDYVDQWYGTTKPHKPIVAAVLELRQNGNPEFARQALYQDYEPHPGAELDLMRLVGAILQIKGSNLSDKMKSRLQELAQTSSRDARSWVQSRLLELEPENFAADELSTASRRRIAAWLSKRGMSELGNGRPESAITLLKKSIELDARRINDYTQLATAYDASGQSGDALKTLNAAFGEGVVHHDEYLRLTESTCTVLELLISRGMPRSEAVDRLCSEENRQKAVPLAISDD
jgi:tetratricopeptide (TPR) repeat protein